MSALSPTGEQPKDAQPVRFCHKHGDDDFEPEIFWPTDGTVEECPMCQLPRPITQHIIECRCGVCPPRGMHAAGCRCGNCPTASGENGGTS